MTVQVVPTFFNGIARYRQVTALDGLDFVLYFSYNSRDGNWYMSIHDAQDEPIQGAVGRKLVVNWEPFRLVVDQRAPLGLFQVLSTEHDDPGLLDLGNGVSLYYVPEADL